MNFLNAFHLLLLGIFVRSDDSDEKTQTECSGCDNIEVPISFGKSMSHYESYGEYIRDMIDINTIDKQDQLYLFANRSTEEFASYERASSIRPKPAACIPDVAIVSLRPENETDPTIIYFPSCTRIRRCGGCCAHQLLSCQPTEIQTHGFEVVKSKYTGGAKTQYLGKELQLIDEHLRCKCDCKIQEKDCNQFQKYDKSQCKCYCTNIDDQHKCLQDRDNKIWDTTTCTCRCRDTRECQTNFHFNTNVCECISSKATQTTSEPSATLPTRSQEERRKFIVAPSVINPDESST